MKFIIGKKIEMTQIWKGDQMIAATKIKATPCVVTQVKTSAKDGYESLQLGFGKRKAKNINKPQKGHFKDLGDFSAVKEFRINKHTGKIAEKITAKKGDIISVKTFEPGDKIKVIGTSKGKGFQGVVKRHGFHGQDKTHGTKDQVRMPGSIGCTGPQRVFKGVRMAGRMGNAKVTVSNLEIIEVDKENDLVYVKGAVPGARNSMVYISGAGELKIEEAPMADAVMAEEEKNVSEDDVTADTEEAAKVEESGPAVADVAQDAQKSSEASE